MHNRKHEKQISQNTKKLVLSHTAGKTESQLETMVCNAARKARPCWEPLKFFSPFSTGWMDRIFLSPTGVTLWVEFKKPGGRYKRLQELNRNWLIRNDHAYYLLDTEEKCLWFINTVMPLASKK